MLALSGNSVEKLLDDWKKHVDDLLKVWFDDLLSHLFFPGVYKNLPAKMFWLHVHHTTAGDSGWGGDLQVIDFEHHSAGLGHLNSLTVVKTQHLVVVKHSVHVLNPESIDWTIVDNPALELGFLGVFECVHSLLHQVRDNTLSPLISELVDFTEELTHGDGLGVQGLDLDSLVPNIIVLLILT